MTPHQRILATINREPCDRTPVDLWLTPEVLASLQAHVGIDDEYALYAKLGLDKICWIFPGYHAESFDPNLGSGTDSWGVPLRQVQSGEAVYQEYGTGPLQDFDEPEELDDYPLWPDVDEFNYQAAREQADKARSYDFATIGPWVSFFEVYCHMRGMENALMDVIAEPEFLGAALDRIESIQSSMIDRYLTELGDRIDIVFISDDLGTQESKLMSIESFQEHLQPRIRRWCDLIHSHGKKVLFHTDGSSRDFVPLLIDAGIDILNPIQHVCPGMDRGPLNADFGDKVIFHGGVENQHVLPYGSVEEVKKETLECLKTLGEGGGYICCSCHNVQAGSPPENVVAMVETVQTFQPS